LAKKEKKKADDGGECEDDFQQIETSPSNSSVNTNDGWLIDAVGSILGDSLEIKQNIIEAPDDIPSLLPPYNPNSGTSSSIDDDFDAGQYDILYIRAPPGKLGVFIESCSNGKGPRVHHIKETSLLVNEVQPGDRILAIDEVNTSEMPASECTRLMASRKDQPKVITIVRRKK